MNKDNRTYSLDFSNTWVDNNKAKRCIFFDAISQEGRRVICGISYEALMDNFNDPHGEPTNIFTTNRLFIENLAKILHSSGSTQPDGTILITNSSFYDEETAKYTNTWHWLARYDEGELELPQNLSESKNIELLPNEARDAIESLRNHQKRNNEVVTLFGIEKAPKELEGILLNLNQSFGGEELYPSIEEKAAHLLYFIIKDHPFVDGNKRIACRLFLLFLNKIKKDHIVNDRTLTALATLIAESPPSEKDSLTKLIVNLIAEDAPIQ